MMQYERRHHYESGSDDIFQLISPEILRFIIQIRDYHIPKEIPTDTKQELHRNLSS